MRHAAPLLALALMTVCGTAASQGFSSVEERMSAAEFREAGLDKLSDAQLQALNAWLQRDGRCMGADAAVADTRGLRAEALDDEADIVSTLPGTFTGWQGGDVFTLANGQVWRAIDPSSALRGVNLTNPRVTISKGLFGAWRLKVEGYNASMKVERVE